MALGTGFTGKICARLSFIATGSADLGVNIMLRQRNNSNQCQKEEVDFHCLFVFVSCLCLFLVMICDKIGLKFLFGVSFAFYNTIVFGVFRYCTLYLFKFY